MFTPWRQYQALPVIATGAAFFMIVLDTSIVNLALARIGTELNSSLATLQWLVDGYALVFASLLLGAGALGDRFGAKGTFMWGLLLLTLASASCGMAPSIEVLQISRIVQGIGAALLLPNSLAALNHTFTDPLRRSKAIAAWASAGALGVVLSPVLGGLLVQALGWRSIFIVNVPAVLDSVERTQGGLASGILNCARQTGGVIGVALLGALLGEPATLGRRPGGRVCCCWRILPGKWPGARGLKGPAHDTAGGLDLSKPRMQSEAEKTMRVLRSHLNGAEIRKA